MIFNSLIYLLFLPLVVVLYWLVFDRAIKRCKHQLLLQNVFLLFASYVFYAWWDWRFLGLLIGMSLISWSVGYMLTNRFVGGG